MDPGLLMEAREGVTDLGCGRAWVSRDEPDSGLEGAPGYSFVAEEA
jgi:hypothetical protein